MNGQFVQVKLPLEIVKEIVAQLSLEEKEKIFYGMKKTGSKKKASLYGYLKGTKVSEKDFKEAERSLFPSTE